jgi:hypothetical protein
MKKLLFIVLFFGVKQINAQCNNANFETGDFTGWTGGIGYNANSNMPLTVTSGSISTLGLNSLETGCSFHTIMNGAGGTDPYGAFPVVDPNGGIYAVRLGGENINTNNYVPTGCSVNSPSNAPTYCSNGESLQQTFNVTAVNALFTYNYAVILEKAPHPNGQQPYFRVDVLDNSGTPIPCFSYNIHGDSAGNYPAGFVDVGIAEVLAWRQNSINLLPYLGQNVTIRFTAAGCIQGGHFGYAYIDCSCSSQAKITIPTVACSGNADSLIAPPVTGGTYTWTGPGIVSGANAQIATANIAGTYSVTVATLAGCSYSLDTTIAFSGSAVQVTSYTNSLCAGSTSTLTASGATTYTWSTNETTAAIAVTPTVSTTYTVVGTEAGGCKSTIAFTQTVINCSTTGINQLINSRDQIIIYPNPSKDILTVDGLPLNENIEIKILDFLGNIVKQVSTNSNPLLINITDLNEGVYFMHFTTNSSGIITTKFMVQHH